MCFRFALGISPGRGLRCTDFFATESTEGHGKKKTYLLTLTHKLDGFGRGTGFLLEKDVRAKRVVFPKKTCTPPETSHHRFQVGCPSWVPWRGARISLVPWGSVHVGTDPLPDCVSGFFFPAVVFEDGAYGEYRRGVDVVGVHHIGYALQRGQDHGLLPLCQALELLDEIFLQGVRRPGQYLGASFGQVGVHLALVLGATRSEER